MSNPCFGCISTEALCRGNALNYYLCMYCISQYTTTSKSRADLVNYKFGYFGDDRIGKCAQCKEPSFVMSVRFCDVYSKIHRSREGDCSYNTSFGHMYGIVSPEVFAEEMKLRQQEKQRRITHAQLGQLSLRLVFAEEPVVSMIFTDDVTPSTVELLATMGYTCEVGPSNKLTITPGHLKCDQEGHTTVV